MRGQQFLGNQNKADFWEGYRPLLDWMCAQRDREGWTRDDIHHITGTHMYSHWFSESQFHVISAKQYGKLREAASRGGFQTPYEEVMTQVFPGIRDGGNAHRRGLAEQMREGRTYFDNTHDAMTDCWEFSRVIGEERQGHATPKPVAMCARAIQSSCPSGGVVMEPFGGSGSTLIAAATTGRKARVAELDPGWCDVIRKRWTKWAREAGQDPGPGALD
jgi:hypothetical protein